MCVNRAEGAAAACVFVSVNQAGLFPPLTERWGSRVDFLTGTERRFKGGLGEGSPEEMDQEYERRLLRQINHQNLPTEARLSKVRLHAEICCFVCTLTSVCVCLTAGFV